MTSRSPSVACCSACPRTPGCTTRCAPARANGMPRPGRRSPGSSPRPPSRLRAAPVFAVRPDCFDAQRHKQLRAGVAEPEATWHHVAVPTFSSYDGTTLAYHVEGSGPVLVCQPGGPGRASAYLGDLGGLTRAYTVVRLDSRGTGDSDVPSDPATYRMDALVQDLEALRAHLGLETMTLLGHSAGANVVT